MNQQPKPSSVMNQQRHKQRLSFGLKQISMEDYTQELFSLKKKIQTFEERA